MQGEILPGWKVIAAYANTDVIYTKNDPIRDPAHPVGTRFEGVPRNTARLFSTYDFQEQPLRGFKVGGGYTFHGSQPAWNFSGVNFPAYQLPGYGTADMLAAYDFIFENTRDHGAVERFKLARPKILYGRAGPTFPTTPYDAQPRLFGTPRTIRGSLRAEF